MLHPLFVVSALVASATSAHVSAIAGAHISDRTGVSPLVATAFEVATPIDGTDEFYRLEFRAMATGIATRAGPTLEALISARLAFAYASIGLSTAFRPVPGPVLTNLAFATGPSFGVRLIDRDELVLRVALHWLPFGTTFNAQRSVAEFWGGWRAIGFQITGSPFVFETVPGASAFFSAAVCVRWTT